MVLLGFASEIFFGYDGVRWTERGQGFPQPKCLLVYLTPTTTVVIDFDVHKSIGALSDLYDGYRSCDGYIRCKSFVTPSGPGLVIYHDLEITPEGLGDQEISWHMSTICSCRVA